MKLNLTAITKVYSRIVAGCGRSGCVVRIQLLFVLGALLLPVFSMAQTATGAQPLGSITSGPDAINLGNLNIHYAFPVFSRPGRGINFTYVLTYDNSIYQPIVSGSTTTWTPVTNFGWRGQTEVATGYVAEKSFTTTCFISGTHDFGGSTTTTGYTYHDPFGAIHPFSGTRRVVMNEDPSCPPDSDPSFTAIARDNSGYSITADDTGDAISSKAGQNIHPPVTITTGSANATDSNGNQITVDNSGNFSDTLGTVALSITGSQTAPPISFNYHDTTGSQQSVVVNYSTFTVQTNFGCANIVEYGAHTTNLPTSINYPDGSSYAISYEATPGVPGAVTGRVASVTLRTGGTISYVYRDGSNGVECSDGSTAGIVRTTNAPAGSLGRTDPLSFTSAVSEAKIGPNILAIARVSAHELGHAILFQGHSPNDIGRGIMENGAETAPFLHSNSTIANQIFSFTPLQQQEINSICKLKHPGANSGPGGSGLLGMGQDPFWFLDLIGNFLESMPSGGGEGDDVGPGSGWCPDCPTPVLVPRDE